MLFHWRRVGGAGAYRKIIVNGLGAVATGLTVIVVILSKFAEGAWITVVTIPALLLLMYGVRRHYARIWHELESATPLDLTGNRQPIVVVPLQQWSKVAKRALCAALAISDEVHGVFVVEEDKSDKLRETWTHYVVEPAQQAGDVVPQLVVLQSPYRFVVNPIVDYVLKVSKDNPARRIIAMVPELVETRWYNYFLHSQRATLLKTTRLVKVNDRISVLNVPYYLK
jgi:hypothetical protein